MNTTTDQIDASLIVCTYNRANLLAFMLSLLTQQVAPLDTRWEMLVIDNNSMNGTRSTAQWV